MNSICRLTGLSAFRPMQTPCQVARIERHGVISYQKRLAEPSPESRSQLTSGTIEAASPMVEKASFVAPPPSRSRRPSGVAAQSPSAIGVGILGAKTLFATHYHELTELEGTVPGVTNYCIAVKEQGEDIVFLRKIVKGGADRSYGIQVARLAGVPQPVIDRAKELAEELSGADIAARAAEIAEESAKNRRGKKGSFRDEGIQMSLFDAPQAPEPAKADPIRQEILSADLSRMTPIEALNTLYRLQETAKKENPS